MLTASAAHGTIPAKVQRLRRLPCKGLHSCTNSHNGVPGKRQRFSVEALENQRRLLSTALLTAGDQRGARKPMRCNTAQKGFPAPDGIRWVPLACRAAYCPVCSDRKARGIFPALRRHVLETVGTEGGAIHLGLTMPAASGHLLQDLSELALEVRSAKNTPRWRQHFSKRIGVVMALEISQGQARRGHPHAHLFAFGPEENSVVDFLDWLIQRWVARKPSALMPQASMVTIGAKEAEWAPHLFYLLKGSHLDPAWDLEILLAAVGGLGAGKHLISFWGLAMGRWSRPSFARRPQAA